MRKIVKKIINKLSKINIDLTKNYKLCRNFNKFVHIHPFSFNCKRKNCKLDISNFNINIRIFASQKLISKEIIYFHGGGFVHGNIDTYDLLCSKIALKTNCLVISVDYKLAPEYKFPIALEECYEIIKKLGTDLKIDEYEFQKIILMGDSAGGNLAGAISLMSSEKKEFKIDSQILIYPVTYYDHSDSSKFLSVRQNGNDWLLTNKKMDEYFSLYVSDEKDLKSPYISLILSKKLFNQPKTLIITAEFDPLKDEGIEFAKILKENNNQVYTYCIKDTIHGFFNYSFFKKQIDETFEYICEFLSDKSS
mgnify:FL=1